MYTGEFFKEPSPDSETYDDSHFGFGVNKASEETSGFGKPVNVHAVRLAESEFWDIPPVMYVWPCSVNLITTHKIACNRISRITAITIWQLV